MEDKIAFGRIPDEGVKRLAEHEAELWRIRNEVE